MISNRGNVEPSLLLLAQGRAGDRLGALLAPDLLRAFPGYRLLGLGGAEMERAGVRLVARTDSVSAMGYSGLLPQVPHIVRLMRQAARATLDQQVACVVAIDTWQPLRFLHRFAPHLTSPPHVCYLPPGPNIIGSSRVHAAVASRFSAVLTPFPHQARLFREAGAHVLPAAHAGLTDCLALHPPRDAAGRSDELAVLPGSRELEVRYGLPPQMAAVCLVQERRPELKAVVCCATRAIEEWVLGRYPGVATDLQTHAVLARARLGIICSGTAALEAAVLGCPGVVTYHGSPLQRWEWNTFHVRRLRELRAQGIASPFVALPNIVDGAEVYPERLGVPAASIAEAALELLGRDPGALADDLRRVRDRLAWEPPGPALASAIREAFPATGR